MTQLPRRLANLLPRIKAAKEKPAKSGESGFVAAGLLGANAVAAGLKVAADAGNSLLGTMGSQIRKASPSLMDSLKHAGDVGDVMAGGFVNRLTDAKLDKLTSPERASSRRKSKKATFTTPTRCSIMHWRPSAKRTGSPGAWSSFSASLRLSEWR